MSIDEEAEEGDGVIFLEYFSLSAVRALRKFHFPSYHRFYASRSAEEKAIMDYVEFVKNHPSKRGGMLIGDYILWFLSTRRTKSFCAEGNTIPSCMLRIFSITINVMPVKLATSPRLVENSDILEVISAGPHLS